MPDSKTDPVPGPRLDKVARIREQLERGTYVTQEKLEATAEHLMRLIRGAAGRSTAQG